MKKYLESTRDYLREKLIPFWAHRAVEENYGGFQTNFDRDGKRTDVTEKSLLAHCRCLFSIAHALRLGFDWPGARRSLEQGLEFLYAFFQDQQYGGYFWILEEDGDVKDDNKIVYGHAFLIYALAEYARLTADTTARAMAISAFELLQQKAADAVNGGYFEHFDRKFALKPARGDLGAHKSLDVHMHLMEALTNLAALTGEPVHRAALTEVTELIFEKMVDPATGTGIAMFTADWQPVANVQLQTVWGRDRFDEQGKPPEITSYGHNIELAWLYRLAAAELDTPRERISRRVLPIFEHTYRYGVDWEMGGLFVEGHREQTPTEMNKEFWQQAEGMVGFLDAYIWTGDEKYVRAFRNIHDFVFGKMINWEVGEWYALLNREGKVIWDDMGTSWKVCYHTIRAMCQVVRRLEKILQK